MFLRIWNLVVKELVQFRRDWLMTAFILTLPVLQLILLAQATGSRISGLHVAVLDLDRSGASRDLITAFDNRQELDVLYHVTALEDTHRLLDQGKVTLAIIVPVDFSASLAAISQRPTVQLVADGSNSVAASVTLRAARGAIAAFTTDLATKYGKTIDSPIDVRTTVRFNPDGNVRFFSIPAQVGFIVYQVTLTVASIGMARERELGTLEQLIVMPLRRVELLVGKAIPALIVGALNFLSMLAIAMWGFEIPLRGSFALLLALTLLFIAVEIGYGIFISAIARTQQQAILLVFVLAMVDMTFSGYLVRVKNLPATLQIIARAVPFSHYLAIIRGVMLKGAGLSALWPHVAAMLAVGVVITTIAVRSLSRRLD